MEYVTIKEVADELGVTKQAIRHYFAKLPTNLAPTKKDGTYLLSLETKDFIASEIQSNRHKVAVKKTSKQLTAKASENLLVELVQNQNKTIQKLQILLDQQQQLAVRDTTNSLVRKALM